MAICADSDLYFTILDAMQSMGFSLSSIDVVNGTVEGLCAIPANEQPGRCFVDVDESSYTACGFHPIKVDTQNSIQVQKITEFVHCVDQNLGSINFRFDEATGEIYVRYFVDCPNGTPAPEKIQKILYLLMTLLNRLDADIKYALYTTLPVDVLAGHWKVNKD